MGCVSGRAILIVLFFSADIIFVVSRVLLRPQSSGDTIADLALLAGRVLGSLILAAVALRLALGHWPWRKASNGIREVTRELTRQISGERRETPLLDRGDNESNSSSQAAVDQLNADASSRQQQKKKTGARRILVKSATCCPLRVHCSLLLARCN